MSRDVCSGCGEVVSTTAAPNGREGYFVSDEEIEKLETALQGDRDLVYCIESVLRTLSIAMCLCDACRARARCDSRGNRHLDRIGQFE